MKSLVQEKPPRIYWEHTRMQIDNAHLLILDSWHAFDPCLQRLLQWVQFEKISAGDDG